MDVECSVERFKMLVTDPNLLGISISFYEAHLLQGFFFLICSLFLGSSVPVRGVS